MHQTIQLAILTLVIGATGLGDTTQAVLATVAGVSDGLTYINKGSSAGLKVGQTLQVYRVKTVPGSTDNNGDPLTRRISICTLTLSHVEDGNSSGKCLGEPPAKLDVAEAHLQ